MIAALWLLIKGINPRVYLGLGLCVAALYGWHKLTGHYIEIGRQEVRTEWVIEKAEYEEKANDARIEEQQKQATINESVKKGHANEISKIRASIASAPKLRVGSAICGEFVKSPEATSTSGSIEADTRTRVVRDDIDRDIKSLELVVEEAFATCRSAQKFITANGLAP
jgi:hypothetical protein